MAMNIDNANWRATSNFAVADGSTPVRAAMNGKDSIMGLDGKVRTVKPLNDPDAFFGPKGMKGLDSEVQSLFLQTVAGLFGGNEDAIPESVKESMKFDADFGHGKPLSARRIN